MCELERFAEMSILNRITQIFLNTSPIFVHRKQVPQAAEQARVALPAALRFLDDRIGSHSFVAGPRPTIADCTLFAAFEHAERADVHIDDPYHTSCADRRPSAGVPAPGHDPGQASIHPRRSVGAPQERN